MNEKKEEEEEKTKNVKLHEEFVYTILSVHLVFGHLSQPPQNIN